jgi:hypothetical protein
MASISSCSISAGVEQCIGRVYRLGQEKPVYCFLVGGVLETASFERSTQKQWLTDQVALKLNRDTAGVRAEDIGVRRLH